MNELDTIAASFGTSEPVYKIKVDSRNNLEFIIKNKYMPPKSNDPVERLLAAQWNEYLDKENRRMHRNVNIDSAYSRMLVVIGDVFINCSTLKNPKQSILYKWFNNLDMKYNGPLSVGFIALYRYIVNNGIEKTRDNANPHAKNVIAILELIREKYEV